MKNKRKDKKLEEDLRQLLKKVKACGLNVRREILAKGSGFRARSGLCIVSGKEVIFIDKQLPINQQMELLIEYASGAGINLREYEIQQLSPIAKRMVVKLCMGSNFLDNTS